MHNATHPEKQERETKITRTIYKCDIALRNKLAEQRELPGWSNNVIARKLGINVAIISQYLNDDGCVYPGDIPKLERGINDLLENESRRRASGIETTSSDMATQIRDAFEFIRKTNDIGVVLAESGDGKSRGIDFYVKGDKDGNGSHPTAIHYRTFTWSKGVESVESEMFDVAGKKNYDGKTKRVLNTVKNLRGSDRLIIVDDAHKLTRMALQWWFDFYEATQCPIAFVGTFELLDRLEDDAQRFSRVGLHYEITSEDGKIDRDLIRHLIRQIVPNLGELEEVTDLCEQVAKEHGHYRSVHKQLKVAVEIKGQKNRLPFAEAFKSAHTMLIRNYKLN